MQFKIKPIRGLDQKLLSGLSKMSHAVTIKISGAHGADLPDTVLTLSSVTDTVEMIYYLPKSAFKSKKLGQRDPKILAELSFLGRSYDKQEFTILFESKKKLEITLDKEKFLKEKAGVPQELPRSMTPKPESHISRSMINLSSRSSMESKSAIEPLNFDNQGPVIFGNLQAGKVLIPIKLPKNLDQTIRVYWDLISLEIPSFNMKDKHTNFFRNLGFENQVDNHISIYLPTSQAMTLDQARLTLKTKSAVYENDNGQIIATCHDFEDQIVNVSLNCESCRPTVGFKPGYINGVILNNQVNILQSTLKINLKFIRTGWMKSTIKAKLVTEPSSVTRRQQNVLLFKPNQISDNCTILLKNACQVHQDNETIHTYLEIIGGDFNPRVDPNNFQLKIPITLDIGLTFVKFKEIQITCRYSHNYANVPILKITGGKIGFPCLVEYQVEWWDQMNETRVTSSCLNFSKEPQATFELVLPFPEGDFKPVRGLVSILSAKFDEDKKKVSKINVGPTFMSGFSKKSELARKIQHDKNPCRLIILYEKDDENFDTYTITGTRTNSETGSIKSRNSKISNWSRPSSRSSIGFGKSFLKSTGINLTGNIFNSKEKKRPGSSLSLASNSSSFVSHFEMFHKKSLQKSESMMTIHLTKEKRTPPPPIREANWLNPGERQSAELKRRSKKISATSVLPLKIPEAVKQIEPEEEQFSTPIASPRDIFSDEEIPKTPEPLKIGKQKSFVLHAAM